MLDANSSPQVALPKAASAAHFSAWRPATKRLKRYCWRITASAIWLAAIVLLARSALGIALPHLTSLWGSSPTHLRAVVLSGLLLLLTGFSLRQLLGFAAYLIVFPFTFLIWLLFPRWLSSWRQDAKKQRRSPVLAMAYVTTASLLLFGHGQNLSQDWLDLVIAATWACLIFRSLLHSLRTTSSEVVDSIGQISVSLPKAVAALTAMEAPKNQIVAEILLLLLSAFRIFAYLARATWRNAALLILAEGACNLLGLLAACIVVWAYIVRIITGQAVQFGAAARFSCAHFLSGFPSPPIPVIPAWVHLGAALNAWLLLALLALLANHLHASQRTVCDAIGKTQFDAELSALTAQHKKLKRHLAGFKTPAPRQTTSA